MQDTTTISLADYEAVTQLLGVTTDALNMAKAQVAHLTVQVAQLQRTLYGKASERFIDTPGDQPDLPALEDVLKLLGAPASADNPSGATPAEPKQKRREIRNKGKYLLEIPADLPREVTVIDVPEAERTMADGTPLVKIGEDRDEKLAYRSGSYFVQVTIRPKYAHPQIPSLGVVQEPAPNGAFKGAKVDESLAGHMVAEKYGLHLPLFRQLERMNAEAGIKMTRQHASSIMLQTADDCEVIFTEAVRAVLRQGVVHVDETGVKMLDPGAGQCQNCKAWVFAAGGSNPPPYAFFNFTTGRQQQFLFDVLKDYAGIIQADAYVAYENLETRFADIKWAGCWAHARRKFEECLNGPSDALARWAMRQIRYLFMFERIAWARTREERLEIRQKHEKPIVDGLFDVLSSKLAEDPLVLPTAKITKAIAYLLKRPEPFKRYLGNPDLRIDNNLAERHMRKVALGRKNWLFVGSHKAGKAMAILLTLTQICRAVGVAPAVWFADVLRKLPDWPKDRIAELLPDRWLAARSQTTQL